MTKVFLVVLAVFAVAAAALVGTMLYVFRRQFRQYRDMEVLARMDRERAKGGESGMARDRASESDGQDGD